MADAIATLIARHPGLTTAQISQTLFANECESERVNLICRRLIAEEGRIKRRGGGTIGVSIQARVAELQGKSAERAAVTLEGLIQEAGELQVAGLKLNQISAAVAALTAKAKLAGFWVDKQESTNKNYVVSAEPESTQEEWDEKYVRPN